MLNNVKESRLSLQFRVASPSLRPKGVVILVYKVVTFCIEISFILLDSLAEVKQMCVDFFGVVLSFGDGQ